MDTEKKTPRKWGDEFDREFFTPEEIADSDAHIKVLQAEIEKALEVKHDD